MRVYNNVYGSVYGNVYGSENTPKTEVPVPDLTFTELQDIVGPKRVKTKEVEIEAHDPLKIQQLLERQARKPVRFGQFGGTYVRPKYTNCPCKDPRSDCE